MQLSCPQPRQEERRGVVGELPRARRSRMAFGSRVRVVLVVMRRPIFVQSFFCDCARAEVHTSLFAVSKRPIIRGPCSGKLPPSRFAVVRA